MKERNHIVAEIRRTAKANNGVPLGRGRFQRETGIKESDWRGKYWATWADAVTEVGFPPNSLNSAHDDAMLLEHYAELTRELGRLPRVVDLQLKRRQDRAFPSSKVFERFGPKEILAARVMRHCSNDPRYHDVAAILTQAGVAEGQTPVVDEKPSRIVPSGYVYLVKSGRYYKVGKTNAVGRREYELGIQMPERVKVIHEIATDDPEGIERYWHRRFESKRANGEWYLLTADDVLAFRRRKFM